MRRTACLLLLLSLLLTVGFCHAEEDVIPPQWDVPDYVTYLLEVASAEVGYTEDHGWTKYGEWIGDPYCQWCAEFLGWCVDQVDQQYGTSLLNQIFPLYTGSNEGRAWFITAGRFVVRKGIVEEWGNEWLKGADSYISPGDYIPQPGDWVFLTFTGGVDTDHVAMVEYCSRDPESGAVRIHVIEGNAPVAVARNTYSLLDGRILGYGTVHDVADITMHFGNRGEKVRQLQEKLVYLGLLDPEYVNGTFGNATNKALQAFSGAYNDFATLMRVNALTQNALTARLKWSAAATKLDVTDYPIGDLLADITDDITRELRKGSVPEGEDFLVGVWMAMGLMRSLPVYEQNYKEYNHKTVQLYAPLPLSERIYGTVLENACIVELDRLEGILKKSLRAAQGEYDKNRIRYLLSQLEGMKKTKTP